MDITRSTSITAPDKYMDMARRKIERGHYAFEADRLPNAAGPDA